jgi:hypothetical protein
MVSAASTQPSRSKKLFAFNEVMSCVDEDACRPLLSDRTCNPSFWRIAFND